MIYGYNITQTLTPLGGPNSPIQPPTYTRDEGDKSKKRNYATSIEVDGSTSVVINAVQAEAHSLSQVMENTLRDILGDDTPGLYVTIKDEKEVEKIVAKEVTAAAKKSGKGHLAGMKDVITRAVLDHFRNMNLSSWTASHRHIDAGLRNSIDPDTDDVIWSGGEIGDLLRGARTGSDLIRNFPSSAIFGYWLASGNPDQTKHARAVRSSITGYRATPVYTGYTKVDPLGPIPNEVPMEIKENRLVLPNKKPEKSNRPSTVGLGQIPGSIDVTGFRCGEILQESTVSTRALDQTLQGTEVEKNVIKALALLSVLDSTGDVYRSGADLITTGTTVERIIADGKGTREEVDPEDLRKQCRKILEDHAAEVFAKPITAYFSAPLITAVTKMFIRSTDKITTEE